MRPVPAAAATAALFALLLPAPAAATTSLDTCKYFIGSLPATITSAGNWCLDRNLSTAIASGIAVEIKTHNVVLDCNGYRINGLAGGTGSDARGIGAAGLRDTVVRGCNVRGFRTGIDLVGSLGAIVEDNLVQASTQTGIRLDGDGASVRRNRIAEIGGSPLSTEGVGIEVQGQVEIVDNTIAGVVQPTAYGIRSDDNPGGVIAGNRITGVATSITGLSYGIYLVGTERQVVRDNTVIGFSNTGITCGGATQFAFGNVVNGYSTGILGCTKANNLP